MRTLLNRCFEHIREPTQSRSLYADRFFFPVTALLWLFIFLTRRRVRFEQLFHRRERERHEVLACEGQSPIRTSGRACRHIPAALIGEIPQFHTLITRCPRSIVTNAANRNRGV